MFAMTTFMSPIGRIAVVSTAAIVAFSLAACGEVESADKASAPATAAESSTTETKAEEEKTIESVVEIGVQVNGKMRVTINVSKDETKENVINMAKEALGDKLTGNIVKEIYVPGRIVNIVVK